MFGPMDFKMLSRVLYANDVTIFYRVSDASLTALIMFFLDYDNASRKVTSNDKSKLYTRSIPPARASAFSTLLGFHSGQLPFIYLGVPIFKGKPHKVHLMPIGDRIKAKLLAWKGKILSINGRV